MRLACEGPATNALEGPVDCLMLTVSLGLQLPCAAPMPVAATPTAQHVRPPNHPHSQSAMPSPLLCKPRVEVLLDTTGPAGGPLRARAVALPASRVALW